MFVAKLNHQSSQLNGFVGKGAGGRFALGALVFHFNASAYVGSGDLFSVNFTGDFGVSRFSPVMSAKSAGFNHLLSLFSWFASPEKKQL